MSLDLSAMAADVEAIADKATKEAHQESSLAVMEATWDRIEFHGTANKETETPLVKMIEEDLEVRQYCMFGSVPIDYLHATLGLTTMLFYEGCALPVTHPALLPPAKVVFQQIKHLHPSVDRDGPHPRCLLRVHFRRWNRIC